MTVDGSGASEQAVRAYAEAVGLSLDEHIDRELLAETVELLEELKLLAEIDLGRLGTAVDFSPS